MVEEGEIKWVGQFLGILVYDWGGWDNLFFKVNQSWTPLLHAWLILVKPVHPLTLNLLARRGGKSGAIFWWKENSQYLIHGIVKCMTSVLTTDKEPWYLF